jgi:acetyl-CoA carboxylase biotin carboxyl carrier protein
VTIDLEELTAVIRLISDADFSEFAYTRGDTSLPVGRGPLVATPITAAPVATPPAAPAPAASIPAVPTADAPQAAEAVAGTEVVAPWLGTFYFAPKPGDPPFVHIGDRVTADTVVCIIEVMKLMNTVTAGVAGVIAAVHARDGDLVEHGQPLFTVVEAA